MNKTYELRLPVSQGDDFHTYLEANNNDSSMAFIDMANQYKKAAEKCRLMSIMCTSREIKVSYAGCHTINIEGDKSSLDQLVNIGLLSCY